MNPRHPSPGLTAGQAAHLAAATARPPRSDWEAGFLRDLAARGRALTPKQAAILARCARPRPDYAAVNRAALARLPELLERWLPGGRVIRGEWTCAGLRGGTGGSCKVNLRTGAWADFATGDHGGDPIALAAAVADVSREDAALRLAAMLGMEGATDA